MDGEWLCLKGSAVSEGSLGISLLRRDSEVWGKLSGWRKCLVSDNFKRLVGTRNSKKSVPVRGTVGA